MAPGAQKQSGWSIWSISQEAKMEKRSCLSSGGQTMGHWLLEQGVDIICDTGCVLCSDKDTAGLLSHQPAVYDLKLHISHPGPGQQSEKPIVKLINVMWVWSAVSHSFYLRHQDGIIVLYQVYPLTVVSRILASSNWIAEAKSGLAFIGIINAATICWGCR